MYLFVIIILFQVISIVIEALFIKFYTKNYVNSGLVVFNKKLTLNNSIKFPESDIIIKKKVGDFLLSNDKNIYVYPKLFWSGWYNYRTKYSLRLLISQLDNTLLIKGKISIVSIIFDVITIVILLVVCCLILYNLNITLAIFASFFILFIVFISFIQPYFAIKDNYNSMIKELKIILAKEKFKM